jgi:rfaE bifunctional protein kinase chain/domain
MNPERLEEILSGFSGKRVLVIGDLMLDHYLWGNIRRISPEAPVPVVEVQSETHRPGGAANVIHNLNAIGAKVFAIGVVGDDSNGHTLTSLLESANIDATGIVADTGRPTTIKTRVIARSQHILRADREDRRTVSGEIREQLENRIRESEKVDVIFVSDYAKGLVSHELMDVVREVADVERTPVIVDPKGRNFEKYRNVTTLCPNQSEAFGALNIEDERDEQTIEVGHELVRQLNLQTVLMTRGEKGISLFETGTKVTHIQAVSREVFDVSGAGDTTAAMFALALTCGASYTESAEIGNLAGGIVVGKVGVATVSLEELRIAGG